MFWDHESVGSPPKVPVFHKLGVMRKNLTKWTFELPVDKVRLAVPPDSRLYAKLSSKLQL